MFKSPGRSWAVLVLIDRSITPGLGGGTVSIKGATLKGLLAPNVLNGMSESILEILSYLIYRG